MLALPERHSLVLAKLLSSSPTFLLLKTTINEPDNAFSQARVCTKLCSVFLADDRVLGKVLKEVKRDE